MLTIDQATAVMAAGIPVKCRGMEFLRIILAGRAVNDHKELIDVVVMEDRRGKTTYRARPEEVTMHGEVDGIYYELVGNEVRAVRGVVE